LRLGTRAQSCAFRPCKQRKRSGPMNWDQIAGNWRQAAGKLKEKRGKLTDTM